MDLHDYYLRFPALDISLLQIVNDKSEDNELVISHRLIQSYKHELTREKLDISKLEICRMLLCYEYQLAFGAIKNESDKIYVIPVHGETTCFNNIREIFPLQHVRSNSEILILRDIIILQMILYCNNESIDHHMHSFLSLSDVYLANSNARVVYMKILKHFLEFLYLHKFLHNDANDSKKDEKLKELSLMYFKILKSWMKIKEDSEWSLFASMFSMLVDIFSPVHILFPLWDYVLNEIDDLKESLIVLSIMADTCFTLSRSVTPTYIQRDIYSKSTFWLLILKGLQSPLQQYRKQALYIMKKATDSMSNFVKFLLNPTYLKLTKAQITPFMCDNFDDIAVSSVDFMKLKYFLVYEALEEKQYHLVEPALDHLTILIEENERHKSCKDCCNVWLQCILERVLQHKNNNIVKWGVLCICKLDESLFDDQFIELFLTGLNNTFLYECQPEEECPEIVMELSAFFKRAKESNLLNRFFEKISRIVWGPIPIFYIVHVLQIVSHEQVKYNNWQATELNVIKSLVETNLSKYSQSLRIASQIELLRAIPNYMRKIDDVTLLANTLAAFPYGEGLTRGTTSWNVITTWLKEVLPGEDAIAFVQDTCVKNKDVNSKINPRTFALMIYLLYDANLIFTCKTCPAEKALNNWMCTLNTINVRPYADIGSSIDIAEFISHLLNLSMSKHSNSVTDLILLYIRNTFRFLITNMKKMVREMTYEDYTRYVAILSSYIANASLFMLGGDAKSYAIKLQDESICLLKDLEKPQDARYLYGLHVLHLSQNISPPSCETTLYMAHILDQQISAEIDNDTVNLKGKLASEYYLLLAKLLHQYIINASPHLWTSFAMLFKLQQFLELGTIEVVPEVAMILTVMIDKKIIERTDRKIFESIFTLSWNNTISGKRNNIFWSAVQNLTGVVINDNFLDLDVRCRDFLMEFIRELLKEGGNSPRFKRILVSNMAKLSRQNLVNLENLLMRCACSGFISRRDQKIENHTNLFIAKHLGQYYPKHFLSWDQNNDTATRAQTIVLIYRVINHPDLHYDVVMMVHFIYEALKSYKRKRYFNDSCTHALKIRLMQMLLIIEPVLTKEHIVILLDKLSDLILSENDQPSVKLMLEWLMIRIFTNYISLHDKLWSLFAMSLENRSSSMVSVASIVYHVARLLTDLDQKNFIRTALPYIAQCCLGQRFNVRSYNQFILIKLYELMKTINDDDSQYSEYEGLYQAASLQQENSTKNLINIQDNIYFSKFHPIHDYSLQTIYYDLPRLTDVNCNEWINPDVFKAFMFDKNDNHPLQLYNINSVLSEIKTPIYFTKSSSGDIESSNVETYLEDSHDIQKKIEPVTTPLYNISKEIEKPIHTKLHEESLIVVASFVNRLPNLGGIARTCEIFGVKTLVVANLDCVKNDEFHSVSVSAEKWINMLQVKPYELQDYLLEKKNAGWSLIGVEQTANSINLLEANFKKRTILVLGNEKSGIPANFLPLFDMCIEIPQAGVIRSLNVHVTAAICTWQYAKQHVLKDSVSKSS